MFDPVNSKVVRGELGPGKDAVARRGAMIAYQGDVLFSPIFLGGNMSGFVGRQVSGEDQAMMKASGRGSIWYGFGGMDTTVLRLSGESLTTESSRILCHEPSLHASVVSAAQAGGGGGLRGAARGVVSGQGFMTTQLTGHGMVVLLSHGGTIEIPVQGGGVTVDPQAYIAHRGQLHLKLQAKVGWREAVGRGSGEAMQLEVTGHGSVLVQASEKKF
nr:AIM24 family protein [Nakamurella alba]